MTVQLRWQDLAGKGQVALLQLNRPDAANAFNSALIADLTDALRQVADQRDCRLLVLSGNGRHFSAGADLEWMKAAARLDYGENLADAKRLGAMFEALHRLPVPSLALVSGAAYGGAIGLIACCDYALASDEARFCLSEVSLGLLPAVILPYLTRKFLPGHLRRLSLSARVFNAPEALTVGLVEKVLPAASFEADAAVEIAQLLTAAPEAQRALKQLHHYLEDHQRLQGDHTAAAIAAARVGAEAQEGFRCFFAKAKPPWVAPWPSPLAPPGT